MLINIEQVVDDLFNSLRRAVKVRARIRGVTDYGAMLPHVPSFFADDADVFYFF
jgi:hypothetical protein